MAIIKFNSYDSWGIATGDDEFDADMGDQLRVTGKEVVRAINAENMTDVLFARILKDRSAAHESLMKKIPGASDKK